MSAAQLAVQVSNMPGTDQEAIFAAQAPLNPPTRELYQSLSLCAFQWQQSIHTLSHLSAVTVSIC